jgi:DNA-binding MltR family transcriptional regulator
MPIQSLELVRPLLNDEAKESDIRDEHIIDIQQHLSLDTEYQVTKSELEAAMSLLRFAYFCKTLKH